MELNLEGSEVTQVAFGFELVLLLWPEASIQVGGSFVIAGVESGSVHVASPELAVAHAATLARLFGTTLTLSTISEGAELCLQFSNGAILTVPPSREVEAFGMTLSGSPSKVVCIAGGQLEIWD